MLIKCNKLYEKRKRKTLHKHDILVFRIDIKLNFEVIFQSTRKIVLFKTQHLITEYKVVVNL